MVRRIGLLFAAFAISSSGCATADDAGFTPANGKQDSGKITAEVGDDDTGSATDTGSAADSSSDDTGATTDDSAASDTGSADTTVAMDSAPVDSGMDTSVVDTAPPVDAGSIGKFLIFDDSAVSLAPAAITALGGTYTLTTDTDFNTAFDGGGFDGIIVDCSQNYLPTGADTRISTWISGGHRIVFADWNLASEATLASSLGVTTVSYMTVRNVYKDATSVDLFAGIPSPLTQTTVADDITINGVQLTVTAPSFLAARLDSATGPGAIAITHGGKVLVNGFMPFDFVATDADSDGKKDVQELYESEVLYVLSK